LTLCNSNWPTRYNIVFVTVGNLTSNQRGISCKSIKTGSKQGESLKNKTESIAELFANLNILIIQRRRWLDADMATYFATIFKVNINIWMVDVASGGYRGFYVSKQRGPFRACEGRNTLSTFFIRMQL
jgi:hypothetical protein